jgi:hypothetical protein
MQTIDLFDAYKKTVASTKDETICWWYFGVISAHLDDGLKAPCTGCQTLMAFRVQHPSASSMRIDWLETCLLRDLQRGELAETWFNPLTGRTSKLQGTFYDGPVTYLITKNGDGLDLEIRQQGATVRSTSIAASVTDGRIVFTQTERKVRAFAQQSAGVKEEEEKGVDLHTQLTFTADLAEVQNPQTLSAASSGYYLAAVSGMISKWMDFGSRSGTSTVKGVMVKSTADEVVDPKAWATFKNAFPDFFDGERVSPLAWRK